MGVGNRQQAQVSKPTEIKIDLKTFDQFVGQYTFADNPIWCFRSFAKVTSFFFRRPTRDGLKSSGERNQILS